MITLIKLTPYRENSGNWKRDIKLPSVWVNPSCIESMTEDKGFFRIRFVGRTYENDIFVKVEEVEKALKLGDKNET